MARLRFDAVKGVTQAAIDLTSTTIISDGLKRMGIVVSPDVALICFWATDINGNINIAENVYVTSHAIGSNAATITRAGDGTTATSWPVGSTWTHGLGVADVTDIETTGVTAFNSRTGSVTFSKSDVTGTGLTYSDVNADQSGAAAAVLSSSAQKSNNLSDLTNAATARTNLGLGTAATQASTAFDAAGAATTAQAAAQTASLPRAGGTMSGAIAMGGSKITGLANGSVTTDAAAYGQVVGAQSVATTPGRFLVYGHSWASQPLDPFADTGAYGVANGTKAWPGLLSNMLHTGRAVNNVFAVQIPASAAGTTTTTYIGELPEESWIDSIAYLPVSDITGAATNYRQFTVTATTCAPILGNNATFTIANLNMVAGQSLFNHYHNPILALQNLPISLNSTPQTAYRNASNAYTMAGSMLKGGAYLQFVSTKIGTGIADPGGILLVRYGTKYRNHAIGGSQLNLSGIFNGGWASAFAQHPVSQSYSGLSNTGITGATGEVNVTTTATAGTTTIACDPLSLGSFQSLAIGTIISFGVGTNAYNATLSAAASNGATSLTVNALGNTIPAGSQGYVKLYGYESLVSNGFAALNWGINDAGSTSFDVNAITETFRATIANISCAYMAGATQSNIVYSAGTAGTWNTHAQPVGGQFYNPQTNTNNVTPTGGVKMYSGTPGATKPTITIQLPPAFEGGTVDLFFLALAGANNGGAASILVDGTNPPAGACTINTNNCATLANVNLFTGTITSTTTLTTTGNMTNPYNLGQFVVGTGVPANTYISQLATENSTVVTTAYGTGATLSQACTNGAGLSLSLLGFTPMVKRLTNLAAGAHSIVITLNSMGAGSNPAFFFYGYGIEPSNTVTPDLSAPVAVLNCARIPSTTSYGSVPVNTNAASINTARTAIMAGTATSTQSGNSTEPALNSQAFVVDIDTPLGNGASVAGFTTDGLHPNGRGHAIVAQTVWNAIASNTGISAINMAMTSG